MLILSIWYVKLFILDTSCYVLLLLKFGVIFQAPIYRVHILTLYKFGISIHLLLVGYYYFKRYICMLSLRFRIVGFYYLISLRFAGFSTILHAFVNPIMIVILSFFNLFIHPLFPLFILLYIFTSL